MTDLVNEPGDATPLSEEERKGLLLPVLNRAELNRAEAENISQAMSWLFFSRRRLRPESVTREAWLKQLHRRMYSQVWWGGASLTEAGQLRRNYITALRAADAASDFGPLMTFARS